MCIFTARTVYSASVPVWVHLCTASALHVLSSLFTVTTVWRDILCRTLPLTEPAPNTPNLVVNRVQVRAVWWPHRWCDKIGSAARQQIHWFPSLMSWGIVLSWRFRSEWMILRKDARWMTISCTIWWPLWCVPDASSWLKTSWSTASMWLLVRGVFGLPLLAFRSADPVSSIFRRSWFSTEWDHVFAGNSFKSCLALYFFLSQDLYQNSVLFR